MDKTVQTYSMHVSTHTYKCRKNKELFLRHLYPLYACSLVGFPSTQ